MSGGRLYNRNAFERERRVLIAEGNKREGGMDLDDKILAIDGVVVCCWM
jgi:hypothetical protein